MDFYEQLREELKKLEDSGLLITIRTLESAQGAWININGKKVLNMCSNNYLGLANNERLKEAAINAIKNWGVGPGAVRTIAGTMKIHEELEKKLAEFKKVEATLVVQSGFNANQAVIPTITNEEDGILSDELNHASIIDGVRLSKAKRYIWKHKDLNSLEEQLVKAQRDNCRRKLIITDGVFSMDGDIAPLPGIVELAKKYDALVMVDDAHGEGVLGENGRGIADHFNLTEEVDIEIGTLSKAFGVVGGFIAGKKVLIDYLKQQARPFLFSSSLSPAETAAALEATKILYESDDLVKKLWDNAKYFQSKIKEMGYDIGGTETPITPVMIYDEKKTKEFSSKLYEEGIFASSIVYPTVPKGKARIRVMISALHSKEDLDFALSKFEKIGKSLGTL
ncbi:pyridoxal phosphate-dependent acyltransferase [Petrotoga mobilis SJ95]|uniref:8-amino-7-oxononanoate synthase n=1 Tax=Petrotoga mobilis (strain DSM 10674 / SJ95) TaxID=403833 RepID=BIOF_PETMO|nr:glycine C-acetyltransferase [Petrotoga mobilis]A9BGL0.1 RecName: Full=8-amino-7-oxononanoate synthase; Short=AONS; AltName: Full=7-keto-8-amino-pelargonic acid synthase; Short=7-KAP synthase; Short=KAPA synthase; AltName: Full=8-amino-7-ketopelargonate synthase; AltName: Full=Alpha-oxoamine synthase [Petrotoga mobilis SJ95]ABX32250.1 pyridoxal phosphate-dependent acyltransferase [Petrotoga mobilis SJ95]